MEQRRPALVDFIVFSECEGVSDTPAVLNFMGLVTEIHIPALRWVSL